MAEAVVGRQTKSALCGLPAARRTGSACRGAASRKACGGKVSGGLLRGAKFTFDERIPYYLQLKSFLEEKIVKDELRPGDKLPSEAEICEEFSISRTVVRQALREMGYAGLVYTKKGKGAYVSEPKILESFLQTLSGFYQDMAAQHLPTHSHVLRLELVAAGRRIEQLLRRRAGSKVVLLRRLRFVGDDPVQLVSSYLPARLCPGLLDTDFTNRSLYAFLEEHGLFLARGSRILEAVRASEEAAELLKVEVGAPLIRIESIGYQADGTPVEYYEALHRGDRTRLRVELVRERLRGGKKGAAERAPEADWGVEVVPSTGQAKGRPGDAPRRKRSGAG